jgi:hypothetical protein
MAHDTSKVSLQAIDKTTYALLKSLSEKQHRTMKATVEMLIEQAASVAGIQP